MRRNMFIVDRVCTRDDAENVSEDEHSEVTEEKTKKRPSMFEIDVVGAQYNTENSSGGEQSESEVIEERTKKRHNIFEVNVVGAQDNAENSSGDEQSESEVIEQGTKRRFNMFKVDVVGAQDNAENSSGDEQSESEVIEEGTKKRSNMFKVDVVGAQDNTENSSGNEYSGSEVRDSSGFAIPKIEKPGYNDEDDDEEEEEDDDDDDGGEEDITGAREFVEPSILRKFTLPDFPVPGFAVVKQEEKHNQKTSFSSKKDVEYDLDDTYLDIELSGKRSVLDNAARKFTKVDEVLKKSVITPGFEKLEAVPAYYESDRILQKMRKKERSRTKGSKWFNMPATEITEEVKNDLKVLQMRSILDPKHFYKKNDLKVLPKYFQMGKVVDSPADFYNSRIPNKQRKRTMVDELLADAEFKNYNKKRYKEIIEERRKTHYKAHSRAKKLKRKK